MNKKQRKQLIVLGLIIGYSTLNEVLIVLHYQWIMGIFIGWMLGRTYAWSFQTAKLKRTIKDMSKEIYVKL